MQDGRPAEQIFGIRELYRPASGEAEVDIVAVHGLNGDALRTWTWTDDRKPRRPDVNWLADPAMLPRYVPTARVLAWGYNANISSLGGHCTSADRVLQHAQTLVAQLNGDRELEDMSAKPIIFLCHSLGGIIVKRALAYAASRTAANTPHLHSIYTCTYGILFFGTPHMGSSKARLLGSLQKLAALATPKRALQLETGLVGALEEQSETLQNITDQFAPLLGRFRIFFFWEQERSDLLCDRDYIVHEASAAPILDNTERSGIAADHRGMCRFASSADQGFRTVMAALRRYVQNAPGVVGKRIVQASAAFGEQRRHEAMELIQGVQIPSPYGFPLASGSTRGTQIQASRGSPGLFRDGEIVPRDTRARVAMVGQERNS